MNPPNDDFDGLTIYGDERLITRWQIYRINDDIVLRLNNGLIISVKTNQMCEK